MRNSIKIIFRSDFMDMMKGLVAYPNGDIKLEEVPVPTLGDNPYAPHDVLLEVQYCGICGSDIHKWKADKKGVKTSPKKVVVGHEIVSVVKVEKEDLRQIIMEKTGGIGVDNVLENTGSVEPIVESLDIVRKGGKVLWAGGGIRGGIVAPVDTYKIIVKEITIYGEISQIPYDWLTAIHLVGKGAVKLKPLVTHVFDLDDWEAGFDLAATSAECLRVAIRP